MAHGLGSFHSKFWRSANSVGTIVTVQTLKTYYFLYFSKNFLFSTDQKDPETLLLTSVKAKAEAMTKLRTKKSECCIQLKLSLVLLRAILKTANYRPKRRVVLIIIIAPIIVQTVIPMIFHPQQLRVRNTLLCLDTITLPRLYFAASYVQYISIYRICLNTKRQILLMSYTRSKKCTKLGCF